MSEVSIKLQGGLGNYMFQIACVYIYGIENNKEAIFTADDSVIIHKHISVYKNNVLKNINIIPNKNYSNFSYINESSFNYNAIPSIDGDVYLNGYFQSEKYFKNHRKYIIDLFSYPQPYVDAIVHKYENLFNKNTCSIHVRRGDYLNFPNNHPTQSMNYYMKAIKQMPKDSVFLIFSDDIAWCKQNFPELPEKFIFIEGNTDHEDLLIMSMCKNNIICNSTFSWWASWLNNNPNKIIIAPSLWFGPAYAHYNVEDLYCENWIKI